MFIVYKDKKKIINLDNFDTISVIYEDNPLYNSYYVVAQRNTIFSDIRYKFSGNSKCIIADFLSEKDANNFYDRLQASWINGEKVFEV